MSAGKMESDDDELDARLEEEPGNEDLDGEDVDDDEFDDLDEDLIDLDDEYDDMDEEDRPHPGHRFDE